MAIKLLECLKGLQLEVGPQLLNFCEKMFNLFCGQPRQPHIWPLSWWLMCPHPDWKRGERETGRNIPGIRSTDCTTKYRLIWVDINQKGKNLTEEVGKSWEWEFSQVQPPFDQTKAVNAFDARYLQSRASLHIA